MNKFAKQIIAWLELTLEWCRILREFIAEERYFRYRDKVPIRWSLLRRGYYSEVQDIYELDKYPLDLYLSKIERFFTARCDGEEYVILGNKVLFERVFGSVLPVPQNLAMIRRGVMRTIDSARDRLDLDELLRRSPDGVVCKPFDGGMGEGIVVIRPDRDASGDGLFCNGTRMSRDAVAALLAELDDVLVVAFVRQAEATAVLHPPTSNTVRVLTMLDPKTGDAFVARAMQRIGVRASGAVDNRSQGALTANVDIETGRIGPAAGKPVHGKTRWYDHHPESGAAIAGAVVPNWSLIRQRLLEAAETFPMTPYIGWDVIPTDDGFSVIEGNYRCDIDGLQSHGGLLRDERVRQFYLHHKVISPRRAAAAARAAAEVDARGAQTPQMTVPEVR